MHHHKYRLTLAGFGMALGGALLFSTKAILVKKAYADTAVDALSLLTVRMVFSLPFYVAAALLAGRQAGGGRLTRRQWLLTAVTGLLGYYASSLFDFLGLQYISAGLERLILFLYPTFAVLINAFLFRQTILRKQKLALVLTYIGILVAYYGELHLNTDNPDFYLGSGLVFLCAITYSFYIAGSGRLIPQVGVTRFTAYAMLAATGGIFLHFLVAGRFSGLAGGPQFWWYGLLLGVVATVAPSFLLSAGMKRIGSSNVAIISGIGPVSTILQAHLVLGEPIFWEQLLGTALVVAGILILSLPAKKNEKMRS